MAGFTGCLKRLAEEPAVQDTLLEMTESLSEAQVSDVGD